MTDSVIDIYHGLTLIAHGKVSEGCSETEPIKTRQKRASAANAHVDFPSTSQKVAFRKLYMLHQNSTAEVLRVPSGNWINYDLDVATVASAAHIRKKVHQMAFA